MKAIIMAGGEGSRLRPLTCDRPKPMVPVFNRPVMEHIIALLRKHGITEVGVTLQYLPQAIKDYFGDGSQFGVNLRYFVEEVPLGTAGSVKNAQDFLDETFLVISGDALTDFDLSAAWEGHRSAGALATIVLTRVTNPLEYGIVITSPEGTIIRFLEKPGWGEVFSDTVNTGIYILEPEVLDFFRPGEVFDFSKNLFPLLLENNQILKGYIAEGYWCDIGSPEQYLQAHQDILEGKINLSLRGYRCLEGRQVWVGPGTVIDPGAKINEPALIGEGCRIGAGAVIDAFTVLGRGTTVQPWASIKRSVIWDHCYIGVGAALRGVVTANRVKIKGHSAVYEGAVVGDDTTIGEHAQIKPGIKIWPNKEIEAETILSRSLIWGQKSGRSLFGARGVTGTVNFDLTPEMVCRLGAALGTSLGRTDQVVVSSGREPAAWVLERALVSGIISTGVRVAEIGPATIPVLRYAVRALKARTGVFIGMHPEELDQVCILFLDNQGLNISRGEERKIEGAYLREEFNRAPAAGLLSPEYAPGMTDTYLQEILQDVDQNLVAAAGFKVLFDWEGDQVGPLTGKMLNRLRCTAIPCQVRLQDQDKRRTYVQVQEGLPYLAGEVIREGAELGVIMDATGEQLVLIDDRGRVIRDELYTALTALILFQDQDGGTVAVPVTAPRIIERLAGAFQGKVIRTKASLRARMEVALHESAGDPGQARFAFDALAALARILDFLARRQVKLSALVDAIPEFHFSKKTIPCPWDAKGQVMRRLIEERQGGEMELLDGVRITRDDGWSLVLPDSDQPLFQVYSEAASWETAEALSDFYIDKVRQLAGDPVAAVETLSEN